MAKREKKPTEFVLGPRTRASYVHLLEKAAIEGGKPHYSCCFLIPKDDTKTVEAVKTLSKQPMKPGKAY